MFLFGSFAFHLIWSITFIFTSSRCIAIRTRIVLLFTLWDTLHVWQVLYMFLLLIIIIIIIKGILDNSPTQSTKNDGKW